MENNCIGLFGLLFYFAGCLLSFIMIRYDGRKRMGDEYGYGTVMINLLFSFFSWFSVLIMFCLSDNFKLPKPPRFL